MECIWSIACPTDKRMKEEDLKDFTFCNPVEAVFGEGIFNTLAEVCEGRTVMLLIGAASAKESGAYDKVRQCICASAKECHDFDDVTICTYGGIVRATEFARANQVDVVVGMGGAAVMDTAKASAFCAVHEDFDAYLTHEKQQNSDEKLPLVLIPTYPSTGSEANGTSDIMGYAGSINNVYADHALLYPPFTYSLGRQATAFSTMVLLAQTGYRYFTDGNPISRAFTAASLRCVLNAFDALMDDPCSYEARGVMLWASFLETSGLLGLGMEDRWTYSIFSANGLCRFTVGTSYREGLSVMLPRWLVWAGAHHPEAVRSFVVEVLGGSPEAQTDALIAHGYERLMGILRKGGLPLTLDAYGPKPSPEQVEAAIDKVSSREFTNEEYQAMMDACYNVSLPKPDRA